MDNKKKKEAPGEQILATCENLPEQAREVVRAYGRAIQTGAQIGVALAAAIVGVVLPDK